MTESKCETDYQSINQSYLDLSDRKGSHLLWGTKADIVVALHHRLGVLDDRDLEVTKPLLMI